MRRFLTLLAALAIAATLAVALVVVAPAGEQERTPLTNNVAGAAIGLPVFSSDGKQLGKVVAEGIDEDDQPVIVAEVERPLEIATAVPHLHARATTRSNRFDDHCRGGCQDMGQTSIGKS
jgi:hypothetical protein